MKDTTISHPKYRHGSVFISENNLCLYKVWKVSLPIPNEPPVVEFEIIKLSDSNSNYPRTRHLCELPINKLDQLQLEKV